MGVKTTLTKATSASKSLRCTVPSSVVKQLGIKEKDELDWTFEARNGELAIVVHHIKK